MSVNRIRYQIRTFLSFLRTRAVQLRIWILDMELYRTLFPQRRHMDVCFQNKHISLKVCITVLTLTHLPVPEQP